MFVANVFGESLPAFVLRHDVDGCLWQPTGEGENFSLKHVGTLSAFGYVQASKQQKKFSTCSPNLNYSVICESTRHVFLYRQQKTISSGELRNRTTSKKIETVAQQQVITTPDDEILGVFASEQFLYLLFRNQLLIFSV